MRRRGLLAVGAVLAVGVAWAGYAASSSGSPAGYVTATASLGSVTQTINLTGNVAQADTWTVHFPVSGRVAAVSVAVGQTVSAGQQLARLDPTALNSALLDARATLTAAQATVESDQSTSSATAASTTATTAAVTTAAAATSQSAANDAASGSAASGGSGGSGGQGSTGTHTSHSGAAASGAQNLASLLKKLTAAQHALDTATSRASHALALAEQTCSSLSSAPTTSSAQPSATPTPSGSATPQPTASSPSPGGGITSAPGNQPPGMSDCLRALTGAAEAQRAVGQAQSAFTKVAGEYAHAAQQAASAGSATSAQPTGNATPSSTGSGTTSRSTASTGGRNSVTASTNTTQRSQTGGGVGGQSGNGQASPSGNAQGSNSQSSASRLITDQSAVASAQVAVDDAETDLAGAVLTAPAAGTVAAVNLTAGTTASTSATITITRPGSARVTVAVPLAELPKVRPGQSASIVPDGSIVRLAGTVASIGLLPTNTSSSTPSYPVTVMVPNAGAALATGSRAQVSITIGTAASVLTVPNSALTATGTGTAIVSLLSGGNVTRTVVQLGAVGQTRTEVRSGLTAGQTVVLADRSQALPSNSTNNIRGFVRTGTGTGFAGTGGGFAGTGGGLGGGNGGAGLTSGRGGG